MGRGSENVLYGASRPRGTAPEVPKKYQLGSRQAAILLFLQEPEAQPGSGTLTILSNMMAVFNDSEVVITKILEKLADRGWVEKSIHPVTHMSFWRIISEGKFVLANSDFANQSWKKLAAAALERNPR